MNKNKIINLITTAFFTIIAGVITFKVYKNPDAFMEVGIKSMLFAYMLIPIALQGITIKPLHLASIKLQHIMYNEKFEPSDWTDGQLGMAYFIPLVQDFINNKQQQVYIGNIIDSYEEEGYELPTTFKMAKINTSMFLNMLSSAVILLSVFVLPKITNDYDLYRGLTSEELILTTVGLALVIYSIITNINTRVTFEAMDSYLPVNSGPLPKIIITATVVASLVVAFLLLGSFITGIFNINVRVFQFLFNFELIGIYILLSPILLMANAYILKIQTMKYNLYLDNEVKNIY